MLAIRPPPPQSSNLIEVSWPIPFALVLQRRYLLLQPRAEVIMQNGSVVRRTRKMHSDIWQFRWWEKTSDGNKVYRRREIGTVEQIPDLETARRAARLLVPDLNARPGSEQSSMTIAQLCSHFDQRELCSENTWRSYSTKHIYKVYLRRWIIPKWGDHLLSEPVEKGVERASFQDCCPRVHKSEQCALANRTLSPWNRNRMPAL